MMKDTMICCWVNQNKKELQKHQEKKKLQSLVKRAIWFPLKDYNLNSQKGKVLFLGNSFASFK